MQRFPRLATVSTTIALLMLIPSEASASLTSETLFNLKTKSIEHRSTNAPPLTLASNGSQANGPLLLSQSAVVPITEVADAIAKFNISQQLYIQGNTLTSEQISRLITTLKANPNVFVVVMDYSADVFADDETLSLGIANSAAFESVVNEVTGERQGILIMVYFDSNQGRKIFMRSEALPDRLGVGERNFADENGNPKELLNLFIDAFQNEGKDVPGALDVLINRINGTIRQQVSHTVERTQRQRLILIAVASGVLIVLAIALFINARNARIDAQKVLRQAKQKIAGRTKALFQLMEDAEYHSFKTYTGHTQHHAHTMLSHITDAITLAGGTDVVLAEAERLIHSGHLTNRFWTGQYKRAIALLTNENTALSLEKVKSIEAVLKTQEGAMTDLWRSHLSTQQNTQQAKAQAPRHSFQNILDLMADHRQQAVTLLEELIKKDSGIASYFNQIETHATKTQVLAQDLQTLLTPQTLQTPQIPNAQDPNTWFKVPAVLSTLLPLVTASGGYLVKGRQAMETDPIMAWDHYATGGDRIIQEARQMIDLGTHARQDLLPTLAHTDYRLHPHHVSTDWAHHLTQTYAQTLEQLAKDAVQDSVAEAVTTLQQALDALGDRLQTIVRQDEDRRTTAVQQIHEAEADVANHRQSLCQSLKTLGFFQSGQPEQVLREADTDPSVPITQAKQHWQSLKSSLDQGNVEESQSHLDQIQSSTQQAHQWVDDTQSAVNAYPTTLQAHKDRIVTLHSDRQTRYIPLLHTIQQQYEPIVLERVAPEVNAGQTIADNADHAQNLLTKATETLKTAVSQMDTAHILTAQTSLNTAARLLSSAQAQLSSIEHASQILTQRQEAVGLEYEALRDRCDQTQRNVAASYVRSTTQHQWDEIQHQLNRLADKVHQRPYNPYVASDDLQSAEQGRQRLEDAIATDKRTFEKAKATIRRAESALQSAENDIHSANHRHFRYATVNTSSAQSILRDAERELVDARRSLQSQHYETSHDQAQSAISDAQRASRDADAAVSKARRAHDAEQRRRNRASVAHVSSSSSSHRSSHSTHSTSHSHKTSSSSHSSPRKSRSGSRGGSW